MARIMEVAVPDTCLLQVLLHKVLKEIPGAALIVWGPELSCRAMRKGNKQASANNQLNHAICPGKILNCMWWKVCIGGAYARVRVKINQCILSPNRALANLFATKIGGCPALPASCAGSVAETATRTENPISVGERLGQPPGGLENRKQSV
jgi:hypothetical protein